MDYFDFGNDLNDFEQDVLDLREFSHPRAKVYKPRLDPMVEYDDVEFRKKYRFSKENMIQIINLVKDDIAVDTRGSGVPVHIQVMAVIRHWGRHEIQDDSGELHGLSQPTMSRICKRVARALARKSAEFIKMPTTLSEQSSVQRQFAAVCGFPHVIGAIDCTHIKIRKVGGETGQYFINRKGQYSINTQVVCGPDLSICDIVCRWRGSTHDARIFRESEIKRRFEDGEFRGKLLGDSGYPTTPYLLTPVLRPQTEAEHIYNRKQIQTRNLVERCFGVWKGKFRILLEVMRGSYETIKTTVIACAVLHNLAIKWNDIDRDAAAWEPGLRVKFNVGLRPGRDFFFDVPRTNAAAILQRWTVTQRVNTAPYSSLILYCPADRVLCAYFDDLGFIAGLQIALAQDEFTDAVFDWETQGFTEWVPATPTGGIKKYWAIQQYFVSEATLQLSAADRLAARKDGVLLQEDAVWVTGTHRAIDRISTSRSDIENSIYTKQACIAWMGRHFYYNMSAETTCTATTMYPWFPLVNSGQLVGTGFMVFGKLPIVQGQRDWFERPPKLAVQVIVPRGPKCLYDLADSVGVVTMHIYYVEKPWTIGCLFQ